VVSVVWNWVAFPYWPATSSSYVCDSCMPRMCNDAVLVQSGILVRSYEHTHVHGITQMGQFPRSDLFLLGYPASENLSNQLAALTREYPISYIVSSSA
jgi:hypothetical protein